MNNELDQGRQDAPTTHRATYTEWWNAVLGIEPNADGRDEGWGDCYDMGMAPAEAVLFMEEVMDA